jgi:hypothetical protein
MPIYDKATLTDRALTKKVGAFFMFKIIYGKDGLHERVQGKNQGNISDDRNHRS